MALVNHLANWSAEDLSHLMQVRPDLLAASDRGLEAVARKASTAMSLGRALVGADVGMLVVAEALVARPPASVADIDRLLGTGDPVAIAEAAERLRRSGIIVVEHGVLFPVGALGDLLHRPLGLGPSFVELADHMPDHVVARLAETLRAEGAGKRSATIRAIAHRLADPITVLPLMDTAPAASRQLLDELVAQRSPAVPLPTGYPYRTLDPDDPLAWIMDAGLVAAVTESGAELPRELVIAAMPDGLAPTAALRTIHLQPVDGLPPEVVAGEASGRANLMLDGAETLLRLIDNNEVSMRKAGGIGPRELARLAKLCGLEVIQAARLLELLAVARLVTTSDGQLAASDLCSRWWMMSRHRRYLALVRAWLSADRFLSRGLLHDGPKVVALGDAEPVAAVGAGRSITLTTITQLPAGAAFEPDQLAAAVVWQGPNLWGAGDPPAEILVGWTLAEAELLGLVAEFAPGPVLRALMREDAEAEVVLTTAALDALAEDQDRFVLQSDMTAVAFGPLAPAVARSLAEMTERVSGLNEARTAGFRFTEQSVRQAFDRGWTAASMSGFLTEHSLAGVPQPVEYLIADVARRYGAYRVQPAQAVIIATDDAAAVELAANRRAASLGLRLIAPTVLSSPLDPVTVTETLRSLGLFPVLEGSSVTLDQPTAGRSAEDGSAGSHNQNDDRTSSPGIPADWISPPLSNGPFPDEIEDAVAALLSAPADAERAGTPGLPAKEREDNTLQRRLQSFWGRSAIIDAVVDGAARRISGTVVAIGPTVAVLAVDGVVELPVGAVLGVEDPGSG